MPPTRIANGWMVRLDLRQLAPKVEQLQRLINVYDGLAVDEPYFHETVENSGVQVAVIAKHLKADHAQAMAHLNVSPALVYRADWLITKCWHERYYEFRGWVHKDGKLFNQAEVLATVGASKAASEKLNADQRAMVSISGVTKSARRVDRIQGLGGRFNTGAVWLTWDTFRDRGAISGNPFYNALRFNPDGGEAIFELPNGLHAFFLYNAKKQLVRDADPRLATDYTVPAGHSSVLSAGISCVRCHASSGGLHPVPNDIKRLVESGTDIVAEFGTTELTTEVIDRLAGLYMGDFKKRLFLGRLDYQEAVRRATRIRGDRKFAAGLTTEEASAVVAALYGDYLFEPVDTATACRELGYDPGSNPRQTLGLILPPRQFRDPSIGLLRAGIPIRREAWEQVYSGARLTVLEAK